MNNSAYKVLGTTDETHICEHCGKSNLKKVVVLEHTETGNVVRYGVTCAQRALGIKAEAIAYEIELRNKVDRMRNAGFGLVKILSYMPRSANAYIENDRLYAKGIKAPLAVARYLEAL